MFNKKEVKQNWVYIKLRYSFSFMSEFSDFVIVLTLSSNLDKVTVLLKQKFISL